MFSRRTSEPEGCSSARNTLSEIGLIVLDIGISYSYLARLDQVHSEKTIHCTIAITTAEYTVQYKVTVIVQSLIAQL